MEDKINISSFQIAASKMRADGNAYFKLFEKHIPVGYGENSTILLYKIDNMSCIAKIMDMNNSSKYIVVTNDATAAALRIVLNKSINVNYLKDFDFEKNDMKFDCIIMNPPYQRNLHLKILAEAIKHLKDEKSVCVNLSPCEWLIDTLNEVKKNSAYNAYKTTILDYLENFTLIDAMVGNSLFNIGLMTDLGLYVCKKECNAIDASKIKWLKSNKQLFDKLVNTSTRQFPDVVKYDEARHRVFVPLKLIANPYRTTAFNVCTSTFQWIVDGKLPNGNAWQTGIYKSKSMNESKQLYGLAFDDEEHAKNFYKSTYTRCFKYANMLVKRFNQHVNVTFLPWLGDAINPRTGLKGYQGEWTDDDFVLYFNITPYEYNIINKTIEKYENN